MASIIEIKGKHRATIRIAGISQRSKTFDTFELAEQWADRVENDLKQTRRFKEAIKEQQEIASEHKKSIEQIRVALAESKSEAVKGADGKTTFITPDGVVRVEQLAVVAKPYTPIIGVYFLFRKGVLIYVGSSRHLQSRIICHTTGRERKIFDSYVFLQYDTENDAKNAEKRYIELYAPEDNTHYAPPTSPQKLVFEAAFIEDSCNVITL